jgi:hypothetical protein
MILVQLISSHQNNKPAHRSTQKRIYKILTRGHEQNWA